jgi:oxalate---CoA ligase
VAIIRTGDQGLILPSGHLRLTGRLKELINRGGEKISPLEVDSALLRIDGVAEAVCFGVEDVKYGEVVWAGIVLKPGQPAGAEDRIKKALNGKVANFKIPERSVYLVGWCRHCGSGADMMLTECDV